MDQAKRNNPKLGLAPWVKESEIEAESWKSIHIEDWFLHMGEVISHAPISPFEFYELITKVGTWQASGESV